MKIYTKKGDAGQTSTLAANRLSKADARIRALGGLDETNAALGVVLAQPALPEPLRPTLARIQSLLFEAGAALASRELGEAAALLAAETGWMEGEMDRLDSEITPLKRFILPGGSSGGAALHWARTVSRRAETLVVAALAAESGWEPLLACLNRLSDLLFVLARWTNEQNGCPETIWRSRKEASEQGT